MEAKILNKEQSFRAAQTSFYLFLCPMNLSQPSSFYPPRYLLGEDSEGMTKLLDGSFHHKAKSSWLPEN
jgi:hypothetical protein